MIRIRSIQFFEQEQPQIQQFFFNCFHNVSYNKMIFKEDSIRDFVNFKLSNPQALHQEMKLMKEKQDYINKLEQNAKQMENLKNQHNMHQELLESLFAKKRYLQDSYEQTKVELDMRIAKCKETIDFNKKEAKERVINNEHNSKTYSEFQKQIALKKNQLTEYHITQLSTLCYESEFLKKSLAEKGQKKLRMLDELKKLKDKQKILNTTAQNVSNIKNKRDFKQKQLEKLHEELAKKEKEIRDQINNNLSMEKVIYGNFYKRCAQIMAEMKEGLDKLFDRNFTSLQGTTLEEKLERMLIQLKSNKQILLNYISQKRQKYKIGLLLPQADAEVYNNIVKTKINSSLIETIEKDSYRNNDYLLKEIEDGLTNMFKKMELETTEALDTEKNKQFEILELQNRIREFEQQIQTKKKQLLSPSKKGKKTN